MEELINQLRRKEGSWVAWGQACQQLLKQGLNPQTIFEQTGFEPIQQNQVIVAAQVYESLQIAGTSPAVCDFFVQKGSDILYELRVLPAPDRKLTAELILQLQLDAPETREVVKAFKELAALPRLPEGFTHHPGDAVAYQVWKTCQQMSDAGQRAKAIGRGLRFAHAASARQQIENLLTAMVVPPPAKAPRLPIYRLEEGEDLPRLLPVAGHLPTTAADLQTVPFLEPIPPFGIVRYEGNCAWVALPSWSVVRNIEDGVVFLADTDTLLQFSGQHIPSSFPDRPEEILLLIDRAQRHFDQDAFFLVEEGEHLHLRFFTQEPTVKLWGKLLLVLRQSRVLESAATEDHWILEE